jgi:predicted deacetylase
MGARYLIRLDDACPTMDATAWGALEDAFDRLSVRPVVGVIPDNRDPSLNCSEPANDFWERVKVWQDKGWAIALHGLHHAYHKISLSDRPLIPMHDKSEFVGLELDSQKQIFRRAYALFREHGIAPELFMAPSHTFDANTLEALTAETDIRIVTDGQAIFPYVDQGFLWIPQQLWRFRRMPFGVWTICLHPNTMSSAQVNIFIEQMERFVPQIVSVDTVTTAYAGRPRGRLDSAFAWIFWRILVLKRFMKK